MCSGLATSDLDFFRGVQGQVRSKPYMIAGSRAADHAAVRGSAEATASVLHPLVCEGGPQIMILFSSKLLRTGQLQAYNAIIVLGLDSW